MPQTANFFLDSLSPENREWLKSRSVAVPLPLRTSLYKAQQPPAYAYFMTSGIASVVTSMADGGTAEVGVIGHEGIVGAVHLLGPAHVPTDCFMQLGGTALKIRFADLQKAFRTLEEIRERILEFVQETILSLSQTAGCNRLHTAEERLARWLLMVSDRTETDVLHITQEFLAQMLGARRTTVTMVAGALQQSGLIEYQRGRVKILSRPNLEAATCDCYHITKQLYAGLYSQGQTVSHE